jgi:ankyrin repeat protein
MRTKFLSWSWAVFLLAGASVGAAGAGDNVGAAAPLADAAQHRDRQAILSLLRARVDVNAPQGDGATALHWAAYWEDAETTVLLVRAGANVNVRNAYGVTPLSVAAGNGNVAVIAQLLKAGAAPNSTVRSGETPLMLAARTGHVAAVEQLLSAGADVNAKETWNGQTALMWAAAQGHAPVVQMLIDHDADARVRSNSGADALFFAVRRGSVDAARALLAAGVDVNGARPDRATPLLVAVINGHEDVVDLLLEKGADPNVEGGTTDLTRPGVRARPVEPDFRPLTPAEADVENRRVKNMWGTPLHAVVHVANPEYADVHVEVKFDKVRIVKSLLAHGANVNARKKSDEVRWKGERYRRLLTGATPFLLAAKAADIELMRLLLANGADPTIVTVNRITPLMAAAGIAWASNQDRASESQVLEAVKLIVNELGADVNALNDFGESAMHAAAYRGANSVVQFLFDKGGKLDVTAIDGRTPLIVADGVEYGNSFAAQPQTAVLLRKLGAREQECPNSCPAQVYAPEPRR